jgi:iron complex transport system ATP-binding protein
MTSLIDCQAVGFRRNGTDILAEVDWRIERGSHWAVLGPNGVGKTTLLRIVCGYEWPTSGRVRRLGRELLNLSELRKSIGWISTELPSQIPPRDTGLETVVSGRLAQIGLKRFPGAGPAAADYADAAAVLERLDCGGLAERPFGVLSQGERQKVLVARALMAGPLLLVLDEPCVGMDPGACERFLGWLDRQVRAESPTVVLVTHHLEQIVPGIQNALILRQGRVYSAGPTRATVTRRTIEEVYRTRLARIEESGGRFWPLWGE